jgi:hypothetical protein
VNPSGTITAGSVREIFVANFTVNTWAAVGAAFTITIVNTVGAGYLTIFPADLALPPAVSTINWTAPGVVLSTGLVTRLGAAPDPLEPAWESRIKVACTGGSTDFVIDMTASWLLPTT